MAQLEGNLNPFFQAMCRAQTLQFPHKRNSMVCLDTIRRDPRWRDPNLHEVISMLSHPMDPVKSNAAAYLQHLCYENDLIKQEVRQLSGVPMLVKLLDHPKAEVHRKACGALRNISYGKDHNNKMAIKNCDGIQALVRLLRKCGSMEVKELVTGTSHVLTLPGPTTSDSLFYFYSLPIIFPSRHSVEPLLTWAAEDGSHQQRASNTDQWDNHPTLRLEERLSRPLQTAECWVDHSLQEHIWMSEVTSCHGTNYNTKRYWTLTLWWTEFLQLCLQNCFCRNVSSDGAEARQRLRECEGLVDALLHALQSAVVNKDTDNKVAEVITSFS